MSHLLVVKKRSTTKMKTKTKKVWLTYVTGEGLTVDAIRAELRSELIYFLREILISQKSGFWSVCLDISVFELL